MSWEMVSQSDGTGSPRAYGDSTRTLGFTLQEPGSHQEVLSTRVAHF